MSSALQDVVVLDMTSSFWASVGTALLADFGARVIRIDELRAPPASPLGEPAVAASWHEFANRNKESIALDLLAAQGRAVFESIVNRSDVFVTDARSDVLSEERIDYQTLVALKPDLLYAHGSGFGPDGPDCDLPALDELAAARTGLMPVLPQPGQPPVYTGAGQMYTAVMLAFGVVTALWHRAETGEGQEIDASLFAGNMYGASLDIQAFLAMGGQRFLEPVSRLDAGNPMSGTLYPTADGLWVTLTMPDTDRWWPGLAEIAGINVGDPRFNSHEKRCEDNRLELIAVLERAFQTQPAKHWRTQFSERQLSADVIEDYSFAVEDEQALRNRFILELQEPGLDGTKTIGFPVFMSETPARLRARSPFFGQHTAEILRNVLGYSEGEIVGLQTEGVVA